MVFWRKLFICNNPRGLFKRKRRSVSWKNLCMVEIESKAMYKTFEVFLRQTGSRAAAMIAVYTSSKMKKNL